MTFLVSFDGRPLSQAALSRAVGFASTVDEPIVVLTVIPDGNSSYARDHEWLDPDESFDRETVVGRLRRSVDDMAPDAEFRYELVDRYAPSGTISSRIKRTIRDVDASMVFIGSDNAGRIAATVTSVGAGISGGDYDVLLVRTPNPSPIEQIRRLEPLARGE